MASIKAKSEATTLEELLSYQDEHFVYHAYRHLLGRAPDPEGMLYYLKRVRAGISKTEILVQLRLSTEGKSRQVTIIGLEKEIQRYYWLKMPILGSLLQLTGLGRRNVWEDLSLVKDVTKASHEAFNPEFIKGKGPIAFGLQPTSQLESDANEKECWKSLGQDPNFSLVVESVNGILPGWYCIELCISSANKKSIAKFYLDTGHGFNETETVILPYGSSEVTSRIFLVEKPILATRFDPKEDMGKFRVDTLQLTSISASQALLGMAQRLALSHAAYDGMCPEDVATVVEAVARVDHQPFMKYLDTLYASTFQSQQSIIDYAAWIKEVERADQLTAVDALATIEKLAHRPLISIIVPVYNTPEVYLRACIESVRAQSYPHWELCIADDASPQPHVRAVLEEYAQRDPRIRVAYRPKNGHISAASNSALALATGEYVALLDHDDELATHALHFMVAAINQNPSARIFYSDEDKIDEQGNRTEPHFKPDWNPDLFFSQNYVSHLGVYRRELLQRIEGFRIGVEGSQDQDLLLRCLPYVNPAEIVHIPKVLYHWRMVEGSTALASGEKSYTTEAGIKALRDFFSTQGQDDIRVEAGIVHNTYRVRYPIPQPEPLVSLLIPTRDMLEMLEPCIRSILDKTIYQNYEIIIMDNESVQPATLDYFKFIQAEDARVKVLPYHHLFNYSAINNYGVQHAKGELIGMVNNDIEIISPEWLTEMVSHTLRPGIGCVGAKLYYADNTIQHAGVILGIGGVANHSHKNFPKEAHGYFARLSVVQNYSAVTAACLLVRKAIYEEVGGLEEEYLKVAFNDIDFCLKVREAGYRNLWTPYAELYHYESKSRGTEDTPEKQARFQKEVEFMKNKWGDKLMSDPYYSPNLTRDRVDFSIGINIGCRLKSL
jgi:glycosyltransferase involved in cell wall biosynthesis